MPRVHTKVPYLPKLKMDTSRTHIIGHRDGHTSSSSSSNTFAKAWEAATVFPYLESGHSDDPSNTRPISSLPIIP